jgi:hypothetical protein
MNPEKGNWKGEQSDEQKEEAIIPARAGTEVAFTVNLCRAHPQGLRGGEPGL